MVARGHGIVVVDDPTRLDRAELDRVQAANITAMAEAMRGTAAWKYWFGDTATSIAHRDDLRELPIFTPQDLAVACPPTCTDLVLDSDRSGIALRSSGTTGRRKTLYHSWEFNTRVEALGARAMREAVDRPPTRVANCLYPGELNGAFSFCQDATKALGAQTFPIGTSMNGGELVEVIEEHRIDAFAGSPGAGLALFSDPRHGDRLASVRVLYYIGENMGVERARRLAVARPDLAVRSLSYSTSETGPLGYQCEHCPGSVHHVHEDVCVVEVVDNSGPVPDGTEGEIVVSVLSDTGMPLLRYQVGDRGTLLAGGCACGSPMRLLDLAGRSDQSMNVEGATVSSALVMACLADVRADLTDPTACQFQVLRAGDAFGIRLLLPTAIATTTGIEAALRRGYHLGRVFGMPNFRGFAAVPAEPDQFVRSARGKTPFFIDVPVDDLQAALRGGDR